MQQTFQIGLEPRVSLTRGSGDLRVEGWDKREISLHCDKQTGSVQQEGNVLMLANFTDDIELWVPYDTEIRVEALGGEVFAQDIRRIELKDIRGDVELRSIGADANLEKIGEAISLTDIGGDLQVQGASVLRARRTIGADANLEGIALVEIETVGADLELRQIARASIGNVGGDLTSIDGSDALRCGNMGGDCKLDGSTQAEINLGNVGGDLEIAGALLVQLGNTGGDAQIRNVQRAVSIGNIGGDAALLEVGGDVRVGHIGGDAELRGLDGSIHVGGIGGDLELQASFPPESRTQLHVGGDAKIALPASANLALQATVGGSISGPTTSFSGNGGLVRLVYGAGAAHVHLSVGGDLKVQGSGNPEVSSAGMPWWEFGQEMADLGQEMGRMGQELGQEFADMFRNLGWSGSAWTDEMGRKVEEQVRKARQKAEQHARKAEERARQSQQRAWQAQEKARLRTDRVHMHMNERVWQMNPGRVNDLANRAQQAAMEGVAGAMEAVERAVNNLHVPYPPYPEPPFPPTNWPVKPVPPVKPVSPFTDTPPTPEEAFAEGREQDEVSNLEQEREAILRMIAEGRITPEEGDMLLEGLGG